MPVLVHQYGDDLRHTHGVERVLGRVFVPQDDVHPFPRQFIGHRLDPRAAYPDAGADGVHPRVTRPHGDARPRTRLARTDHDFRQALADFRHFQGKQRNQQLRRGTAEQQLRAMGLLLTHLQQMRAQTITGTYVLTGNELAAWYQPLGVGSQIQHHSGAFHFLDDPADHAAEPPSISFHHARALRFAHLLHDHLARGLRRDPTEFHRFSGFLQVPAWLHVRVTSARLGQADLPIRKLQFLVFRQHLPAPESFVGTGFTVNPDARLDIQAAALAGGARQGRLNRLKDGLLTDSLLIRDHLHNPQNFVHGDAFPRPETGRRPDSLETASSARRTRAIGTRISPSGV